MGNSHSDEYANPQALVSTEWLASHLDDPAVRVVDARYDVRPTAQGSFEAISGRGDYEKDHIPGAVFVDVHDDLSDPDNPLYILGPERFENFMGHLGIDADKTVVVYDDHGGTWSARLWWALRYYGHDTVRLLNGGYRRWRNEEHPVESGVAMPNAGRFQARVRPELRVSQKDVLRAIDDEETVIVDALPAPFYAGAMRLYPRHRMGHIPGAINVPSPSNVDRTTRMILPAPQLAEVWRDAGISSKQRIITYCGGGVYASFAFFALHLLGHENVALYDGSWMEWGADPNLPIETDCTDRNES